MNIKNLKLYRKRYVPMEILHLKNDDIISLDDNILVTSWDTIKPRRDIARGISVYYMDKGFKVSKVFNSRGELVYWYCDIINCIIDEMMNSIISEDLLLDVVIYDDGAIEVLDIAETAEAFRLGVIDKSQLIDAMEKLDKLLKLIYSGEFEHIKKYVNSYDTNILH